MLRRRSGSWDTGCTKINSIIVLLILAMTVLLQAGTPVRVMTFNIRYNNPKDGPNAWPLDQMRALLETLVAIDEAVKKNDYLEEQ